MRECIEPAKPERNVLRQGARTGSTPAGCRAYGFAAADGHGLTRNFPQLRFTLAPGEPARALAAIAALHGHYELEWPDQNFQHHHPRWIKGIWGLAGTQTCGAHLDGLKTLLRSRSPSHA